jgi:hypothetical protein
MPHLEQPVFFEQTAWDLALATQSLAHIDPQSRSESLASTVFSGPIQI